MSEIIRFRMPDAAEKAREGNCGDPFVGTMPLRLILPVGDRTPLPAPPVLCFQPDGEAAGPD
jgi:hypothetical protein